MAHFAFHMVPGVSVYPAGRQPEGHEKTYRNKLIVFFLTGLWHGANWTFIVWGLWHGFFIIAEDVVKKLFRLGKHAQVRTAIVRNATKHLYTLLVVLIGFVIFRADTMGQAMSMTAAMFSGIQATAQTNLLLAECLTPLTLCALVLGVVFSTPVLPTLRCKAEALTPAAQQGVKILGYTALLLLLVLDILHLSGASYVPFIYFQF